MSTRVSQQHLCEIDLDDKPIHVDFCRDKKEKPLKNAERKCAICEVEKNDDLK